MKLTFGTESQPAGPDRAFEAHKEVVSYYEEFILVSAHSAVELGVRLLNCHPEGSWGYIGCV